MKRIIIAQIKIEMDSEKSDYNVSNMKTKWESIIADHLIASTYKVQSYCSLQIDEIKDK